MTKKEIVINYITKKIKDECWKIGESIPSEPKLAEEIGVSRMSVREGIEKLAGEHILIKKHGSGTYVNEVIPKVTFNNLLPNIELKTRGYKEILEVRVVLEPLALRLSMENNLEKLKIDLGIIMEKMIDHVNKDTFIEIDMLFHSTIAKCCGNEFLKNLINTSTSILKFHKRKKEYLYIDNSVRIAEHREIFQSIEKNEIDIAQLYLKKHLLRAIEKVDSHK